MQCAALDFGAELVRCALQHQRQRAGLLAQAREHRDDARKALLLRQCRGQRRAFADQHQRIQRIGPHRAVAQRLGGSLERAQDRHAGRRQHRERAGEARRVVAAGQLADQRQVEPSRIKLLAKGVAGQRHTHREAAHDQHDQRKPAVAAHESAQRQHRNRQDRQRALGAGEHVGHLRHHVADQEDHDHDRHQRDDGRVQRSADQLLLQRLALFEVVGQFVEHQAEIAAVLAGTDHGGVDRRELARMLRQRACER